jgi:hypothetical protein
MINIFSSDMMTKIIFCLVAIQSVQSVPFEHILDKDETSDIDISGHKLFSADDIPDCPVIDQRKINDGIKPKFELNPELFITPVYIWGPSSQLQGLRESIGVAIRLNRTLLLPPFLTHQSDSKGGEKPVPVDIRLDVPELRKLLSIGFTEDLRCQTSDVVFLARGIYNKPTDSTVMRDRVKRIDSFEKATKMKIMRREDPQEAATNPNTNEIDQTRPFLEHSIPVTRSPKVSGAGVQLSNRAEIITHFKLYI